MKTVICAVLSILMFNANASLILPTSSGSGFAKTYGFTDVITPITSPLIVDNDINTGIVLYGEEYINPNNALVEFAPFVLFEFDVTELLSSLTLNIAISSNVRVYPGIGDIGGNVEFEIWNYSTNNSQAFHSTRFGSDIADGIDSYSLTFTESGNNGSYGADIKLSDIVNPTGNTIFKAYGPFHQGIDFAGLPELYLNEVNIETSTIAVPTPTTIWLFGTSIVCIFGLPNSKKPLTRK
jgi:hypothetical protein